MKCVILYQDDCQPISEAAGFNMPYKCKIVEGSIVSAEFESSAIVPFAASSVQMRTAIVNQCIQAAAGIGKVVSANDCTVVGAIS